MQSQGRLEQRHRLCRSRGEVFNNNGSTSLTIDAQFKFSHSICSRHFVRHSTRRLDETENMFIALLLPICELPTYLDIEQGGGQYMWQAFGA